MKGLACQGAQSGKRLGLGLALEVLLILGLR